MQKEPDDVTNALYEGEEAIVRASTEVNAAVGASMKADEAAVAAARDAADANVRAAEKAVARAVEDAKNSDPSAW